ncbi:hypothetical protein LSM04_006366 [Trypanosoma melophagium]|uniref:uncharacterized protein n=1 Tax=Trypanosoma melophagium TaxID=715481 RepID=UPI00351A270E|nr:hypothetical protein LSM04_006366 [Trypanosoma melophagium]
MLSFAAVKQDVELARQLASFFYSSFAAKGTPSLNGLERFATLCGPFRDQTGTYTVTILLERAFVSSRITDANSSHFVVCAEWKVLFGPSYPTETCAWHFDKDCNTGRNGNRCEDNVRLRVRLRSFLVEEVVSRLSSSSATSYSATCAPDTNKHNDYYSFMSRGVNRELSPQVMLPGSTSSLNEASGRLEKKSSDGTIPVPKFLFDFAFLCNWWMSLELDDGCIAPASHQMLHGIASIGNMAATEDEGSGGFMHSSHATHFLEGVGGGNRGQLPKRGFAAVFTPQGKVLMWGFGRLKKKTTTQAKKPVENIHSSKNETSKNKMHLFNPTQSGFPGSSSSSSLQTNTNTNTPAATSTSATVSSSVEFTEVHKYGNQRNHQHRHHHDRRHQWQVLHITSFSSNGINEVLPSLVVPKNLLHTEIYRMNDVCLCAEDPATALKKNIRICRGRKELHGVLNAFRMLRQLVKGASPHAPSLYTVQLLAPALHEVVKALQLLQQPFWAGVAICCFTLPSLLNDRPILLDLASLLIDPVEGHRCVSLVSTVFSIVDSPIQFREAEIAKKAIENLYCDTKPYLNFPYKPISDGNTDGRGVGSCSHSSSNSNRKVKMQNNSSVLTGHPPITECAVCRLPLPHLPTEIGVHDHSDNGGVDNSVSSSCCSSSNIGSGIKCGNNTVGTVDKGDSPLSCGNEDGCITLQCSRCGHGGHVDHILAWWDDSNVRCCPMGCDCLCIY